MKLLCVSTRKSVRAVVHAPAPTVVGMRYSREVLRVKEGSRCFSSTLRRAVLCEGGRGEGGREGMSVERREGGRGDECGEKGGREGMRWKEGREGGREGERGEGGREEGGMNVKRRGVSVWVQYLPWSLSLSPTSSQAFCRLSTIS